MGKYCNTFKKGTLEMLFLKLISEKNMYGYELSSLIHQLSNNLVTVNARNMYPNLYKLEEKGFISSYEKTVGKRVKRVYYKITDAGRQELQEMMEDYHSIVEANHTILSYKFSQGENEKIS